MAGLTWPARVRRWFANAFSADPNNPAIWSGYQSGVSNAGEVIDPDTALKLSTAWAGVHLIANSIGMLPMGVFERLERGRREARNHPLWDILHTQPNASMSAGEFKATLTAHALLRGDGYAEIVPGSRGLVDQLWPIHPDRMERVERIANYQLRYWVKPENGIGPAEAWYHDRVFHLRGLTLDGITGVSFVRYGVESLGLARAAEGYAARVYRNDATPRGVLESERSLSVDAAKRLKDDWETLHSGPNQHRVAILEQGTKYHPISMNPEDAQMLASREYQDVDIARWLGIPLFLLQIMTKSTSWGSGLEQMWEVFKATGLGYWATRWEQAITRDLIEYPRKYYVKINLSALMKAAVEQRYGAYNTGIMAGFMTRNEARELEDWNPIDGLDEPLTPLNMQIGTEAASAAPESPDDDADRADDKSAAAADHYAALLAEAAGRVVRKEIVVLTKTDHRTSGDVAGWRAAVAEFFAGHAGYVAQTLCMDPIDAAIYADQQCAIVLEKGVTGLMGIEDASIAWLCDLAMGKV